MQRWWKVHVDDELERVREELEELTLRHDELYRSYREVTSALLRAERRIQKLEAEK